MSQYTIQISTAEVREVAGKIKLHNQNLVGKITEVRTQMDKLKDSWDSKAFDTISGKFNNLSTKFDNYEDIINGYADFLIDTADQYEQTEEQITMVANDFE